MNVVILGATGFLGSTIFQLAIKNADFITKGTSRTSNANPNIIKLDVTDRNSLKKITEIKAGIVVWSLMDMEKENELVEVGLRNLLAVLDNKTKLIFLSTDALFVEGRGNYKEDYEPGSLPQSGHLSTYINAKKKAESIIKENHSNHVIIRTGPIYGKSATQEIEQRTLKVIRSISNGEKIEAASNLFKTFVHVEDLSLAILELAQSNFTGIIHLGPKQKESYYSFFKKRLAKLGIDSSLVIPTVINPEVEPYLPLDTSLNTQKASSLLQTIFRNVYESGADEIKKEL